MLSYSQTPSKVKGRLKRSKWAALPPTSPNSGFDVSAQPNGDFETEVAQKFPNMGGLAPAESQKRGRFDAILSTAKTSSSSVISLLQTNLPAI